MAAQTPYRMILLARRTQRPLRSPETGNGARGLIGPSADDSSPGAWVLAAAIAAERAALLGSIPGGASAMFLTASPAKLTKRRAPSNSASSSLSPSSSSQNARSAAAAASPPSFAPVGPPM
jgi:hypothetical protein